MNPILFRPALSLLPAIGLATLATLPAWTQVVVYERTAATPLVITDNSAVGVVQEQVVSGIPSGILSLELDLSISSAGPDPMFNGDLYVALAHDSSQAILLNRVGRRTGSSAGYGDAGFTVTLNDAAAADIHTYRLTLNNSHTIPLSTTATPLPLTGIWQPDGRTADPGSVTIESARLAGLSVFKGGNPDGTWTLFLADLAPGGAARLDSWTLRFTAIPEPEESAAAAAVLLFLYWGARKFAAGYSRR